MASSWHWDTYHGTLNKRYTWCNLYNTKKLFSRRCIIPTKNLKKEEEEEDNNNNAYIDHSYFHILGGTKFNKYLTAIGNFYENKIFLNINGYIFNNNNNNNKSEDDKYINGEFKDNFNNLMKSIIAMSLNDTNAIFLLLGEIFNICNVVALDLIDDMIITVFNNTVYIIFFKDFEYISLKMNNFVINDDEDNDIYYNIRRFIKYYKKNKIRKYISDKVNNIIIIINNKNDTITTNDNIDNLCSTNNNNADSNKKNETENEKILEYNFFSSIVGYFSKFLAYKIVNENDSNEDDDDDDDDIYVDNDIEKNWSNWISPISFLKWEYSPATIYNKKNIYARSHIHFRYNLCEIYRYHNNATTTTNNNNNSILTIEQVKEKLLYYNHLFINDISLVDNNVIYIDFRNSIFITLNIVVVENGEKLCEFKSISFYPNEDVITAYRFYIDKEYLQYEDYKLYVTPCSS